MQLRDKHRATRLRSSISPMPWFERSPLEHWTLGRKHVETEGLWVHVVDAPSSLEEDLDANLNVCPIASVISALRARSPLPARRREVRDQGRQHRLHRPAEVHRPQTLPAASTKRRRTPASTTRHQRRGKLNGISSRRQRDGVHLHRWIDGRRCRRNDRSRGRQGCDADSCRSSSSPPPAARA